MRLKIIRAWAAAVCVLSAIIGGAVFAGDSSRFGDGMREVYYDFVEGGKLSGGKLIMEAPSATPELFLEAPPPYNAYTLIDNGPSENRIDLVFVGDGYTANQMDLYLTHVTNVVNQFFDAAALNEYATYFNVHVVEVISNESGVDEPGLGIYRDTALDMAFDCQGIDRLLCVNETKAWAAAEYARDVDLVLVVANTTRYGGAGYPKLATLAGGNDLAVELALHEFGHSFANLADEYHYFDGAVYTGGEPSEENVSIRNAAAQLALNLKWYRWLDLPEVDAFEGAKYCQYGIYRPMNYSKMAAVGFPFGPVNDEQFVFSIYKAISGIDSNAPAADSVRVSQDTFSITCQTPLTQTLNVEWLIDGTPVQGANQKSFCPANYLAANIIYTLTARVTDGTAMVRNETKRASLLTDEKSWQVWKASADFNRDGIVNIADIADMSSWWLSNNPDYDVAPPGRDGNVDFEDFAVLTGQWLTATDPCVPNDIIYLPDGTFQMGDNLEGDFDAIPVHTVTLTSFAMGKYDITNAQYCAFLVAAYPSGLKVVSGVVYASSDSGNSYPYCDTSASSPYSQIAFSNNTFTVRTKGGRNMSGDPMVQVSWYGAAAYCNWRSRQEGKEMCYDLSTWNCDFSRKGYRLATEAEWEYAARGGLFGKRFPWGDTISHSQGNYESYWSGGHPYYPYDISPTPGYHPTWKGGIEPYTSPVGSFAANAYGLYDMAGNVWEWCNDWYSDTYYSSSPANNPTGPTSGGYRILRGGIWCDNAYYCRVASRVYSDPFCLYNGIGFRVVLNK